MNVIAAALKNVYERRESITHGVRIAWEAPFNETLHSSIGKIINLENICSRKTKVFPSVYIIIELNT